MKPRLLIDLDGVIFNFHLAFADHLRNRGFEIPPGFVPGEATWKDPLFKGREREIGEAYKDFVELGFLVEPYPGAIDFLRELSSIYEIIYCTARSMGNQRLATFRAIGEYSMPLGSVIFSRDKGKVAEAMGVIAAMDDDPVNIIPLKSKVPLVVVPGMPYNKSPKIPDVVYIDNYPQALDAIFQILE